MNENAYIDQYLTQFARDLPPEQGLIADIVAPMVQVPGKKFKYKVYEMTTNKTKADYWPKGSVAPTIEDAASWTSGATIRHGLQMTFDSEDEREFSGPGTIRENYASKVKAAVLLQREIALATYMQTAGNFSGMTGTPSPLWDAGANILQDIATAATAVQLQTFGMPPNLLVLPRQVFNSIISSAQIQDWKKRSGLSKLTAADLSTMTGIPNVVIGDAVYDSAALDTTPTITEAWVFGKHAWVAYVAPQPTNATQSWLYHMTNKNENGIVEVIYDPLIKSTVIRYGIDYVLTAINSGAAYFWDSVIS